MARAVLVWPEGGQLHAADLLERGDTRIGRTGEVQVRLDDPTVSRSHAMLRGEAGLFLIENLSTTNPARVNGAPVDRPVPLSDGDRIQLGSVQLTFHDLAAGDRLSGPICSHCSRENIATDKECWYCGTLLVNAPTTILERRETACRLIAADVETFDLLSGECFLVSAGGKGEVQATDRTAAAQAAIEIRDGRPVIASPTDTKVRLRSAEPAPGGALETGDEISIGEANFLVVVR